MVGREEDGVCTLGDLIQPNASCDERSQDVENHRHKTPVISPLRSHSVWCTEGGKHGVEFLGLQTRVTCIRQGSFSTWEHGMGWG